MLDSVKVPPEFVELDILEGNLLIEDVREIASKIAEQNEWWLEPKKILLLKNLKTNQKYWNVVYSMKGVNEEHLIGAMAVVNISDETKEIMSKTYVSR